MHPRLTAFIAAAGRLASFGVLVKEINKALLDVLMSDEDMSEMYLSEKITTG